MDDCHGQTIIADGERLDDEVARRSGQTSTTSPNSTKHSSSPIATSASVVSGDGSFFTTRISDSLA
jgi:hypothetical protein